MEMLRFVNGNHLTPRVAGQFLECLKPELLHPDIQLLMLLLIVDIVLPLLKYKTASRGSLGRDLMRC